MGHSGRRLNAKKGWAAARDRRELETGKETGRNAYKKASVGQREKRERRKMKVGLTTKHIWSEHIADTAIAK
jgi:hypothetical protein